MKLKFLLPILAVLLCAALLFTACDDDNTDPVPNPDPAPASEQATLSLDYDAAAGSVVASAPAGDGYVVGERVTVTVTPKDGYTVAGVRFNGGEISAVDGVYSVVLVRDNTVSVTFSASAVPPVREPASVSLDFDAAQGSVTVSAPAQAEGYLIGDVVTVTVTPLDGYVVKEVLVNGKPVVLTDGKCTVTLARENTVRAAFAAAETREAASVSLDFDAKLGSVTVSAPAQAEGYLVGDAVTVTVTPLGGCVVEEVLVNGQAVVLTDGKCTVTLARENTVRVTFRETRRAASVTVDYDAAQGTVTVSAPAQAEGYLVGDTVTITLSAAAGYRIPAVVLVNGAYASVKDGTVRLVLTESSTVSVTFPPEERKTLPKDLFETLIGVAKFAGPYTYDVAGGDQYDGLFYIESLFAEGYIWNREYNPKTGEIYYDTVYGRDKRNLTIISHTLDNRISIAVTDELFINYYNPFNLLSASDFIWEREDTYRLSDPAKARRAASALTGWNESIADFLITVQDGKVVRVWIQTELIQRSEDISYVSTYDLTVSEQGTAAVPDARIKPYPHDESHDALLGALRKAAAAGSYTVRHQGHEVGYVEPEGGETRPGYGDTDYRVYVRRGDLIYDAYKGEEHGFKQIGSYTYPFEFSLTGELILLDPVNVSSVDDLSANFLGFVPELFRYVGDGVYVLIDTGVAPSIAPLFGEGYEKASYGYATDFRITLRNGVLYEVFFTYKTYGIEEEVTLTYDFSDLPAEAELDFDSASRYSVLTPFIGQYKDDDGHFCNVDKSGFLLNGEEAVLLSYDAENYTFYCTWQGITISIAKLTKNQLLITGDTFVWTLNVVDDATLTLPDELVGTWEYVREDGSRDVFQIQPHVVRFNGSILRLLSCTEAEGVTASLDGVTYNFGLLTAEDGSVTLKVIIVDESLTVADTYEAIRTSEDAGIQIPSEYLGFYISEDGSVKVRISYEGIWINGKLFTPDSFSAKNGFSGTFLDTKGYLVAFYSVGGIVNQDKLQIGTLSDNQVLNRTDSLTEHYIGTWESTDEETSYVVVITDTSVTINGVSVPFRINEEYGYELEVPGQAYIVYMLYFVNRFGNPCIVLYNNAEDENQLLVNLFPAEEKPIGEEFIGTFTGTDKAGVPYTLTIAENGSVILTVAGVSFETTAEMSADGVDVSFVAGSVHYTFFQSGDEGIYTLYAGENDVSLTRTSSYTVPDALIGIWEGTKDGVSYRLEVTVDRITLIVDGVSQIATKASGEPYEFTFVAGGTTWVLSNSYGEGQLGLFSSESRIFVFLSSVTA